MNSQAARELAFDTASSANSPLRLWLRMLSSTTVVEKHLRSRLREDFDTTLPRFDVMAALARHPDGLAMSELSRWLMVSNGNVTGIVQRLVDDGLVDRTRDSADRRSVRVCLSKEGHRQFATQSSAHEKWIEALFSGLTKSEMRELQRLLSKAKQSARES